jgi:hypothetical protein
MGCCGSRSKSPEELAAAAHQPPIPLDHGLLLSLHKAIEAEYDNSTEGAMGRWMVIDLREYGRGGDKELEKVNSTMADFVKWVADVEAALQKEATTSARLLEHWQAKTAPVDTLQGAEGATLRVGTRVQTQKFGVFQGGWQAGSVTGAFVCGEVAVKYDDGSTWQGKSTEAYPYKYGRGAPF